MTTARSKLMVTAICLGLLLTCTACGPRLMVPAQTIIAAKPDTALITFVRATKFGYKSDFHLWDSTDYVGTIYGGQYIQKEVAPGEHMFIAHGQNWAYIKANLEAGRKYYIVLNVTMGFTHAAVVPAPITKDQSKYGQSDINEWLAKLDPVTPNPEGAAPFIEDRRPQVEQAVANGQKPDAKFQVLNPQDYWD